MNVCKAKQIPVNVFLIINPTPFSKHCTTKCAISRSTFQKIKIS